MGNRMKRLILAVLAGAVGVFPVPLAGAVADALRLEREGRMMEARIELARSVERASDDAEARIAWAEFLDRHGGAGVVEAYRQAIEKLPRSEADKRREMLRRLVPAALLAGDADAAREALNRLRGEDPSIWPDAARALQAPASFESTARQPRRRSRRAEFVSAHGRPLDRSAARRVASGAGANIVTGGYRANGRPRGHGAHRVFETHHAIPVAGPRVGAVRRRGQRDRRAGVRVDGNRAVAQNPRFPLARRVRRRGPFSRPSIPRAPSCRSTRRFRWPTWKPPISATRRSISITAPASCRSCSTAIIGLRAPRKPKAIFSISSSATRDWPGSMSP